MVTMAELRPLFERKEREDRFWSAHYAEFLERYPDRFVAVREGKVVAAEPSLVALDTALNGLGLRPRDVSIQWVSKSLACLIL